jgi:flavin reductase (DIM6/NTAB) family NADH-FMN oxidoreductase RutF
LSLLEATWKCGQSSGRDGDKFEALGLETSTGSLVGAPLVEGCIGWLECRLRDEPAVRERYDLVVADVIAAWADEELFRDGRWCFDGQSDRRSFHHLASGHFLESGRAVEASGC